MIAVDYDEEAIKDVCGTGLLEFCSSFVQIFCCLVFVRCFALTHRHRADCRRQPPLIDAGVVGGVVGARLLSFVSRNHMLMLLGERRLIVVQYRCVVVGGARRRRIDAGDGHRRHGRMRQLRDDRCRRR